LGLIGMAFLPAISQLVRRNQWGLFVAGRTVSLPLRHERAVYDDFTLPDRPTIGRSSDAPTPIETPPETARPTAARFDWTRAIVPAWLAISSVLLLRLTVQFLLGRRLARRSEAVDDAQLLHLLEVAKSRLGFRAEVRIRASARVRSPIIWCWGRRAVLLVPSEFRSSAGLDWPSILCHELAHAARRDHVSRLLAELMVCLLPWQPLAWWARQRLAALSEEACDDWVIACGQQATGYARTLLGLAPHAQAALLPGGVERETRRQPREDSAAAG